MKSLTSVAAVSALFVALLLAAVVALGVVAYRASEGAVGRRSGIAVTTRELHRDSDTLAVEVEIVAPEGSRVRLTEDPGDPGSGLSVHVSSGAAGGSVGTARLFVLATLGDAGGAAQRGYKLHMTLSAEHGRSSHGSSGYDAAVHEVGDVVEVPLPSGAVKFDTPTPAVEIKGTMHQLIVESP